ncbi:SGNH/GDSL hydrolase family protein [Pararcticibacter amylolyticus]|uniref:SGNH/GDSL hydrolase family protein n=1 Tax=Pararcticibacter amylolyticus TaxID=2173175 RepID=A0A2U2PGM8_9SPHI|nr:SGNH/GDSL hydrolase family protein [Pararcticibacter amylolyticus]PWG80551.1 SGNH/GDSL hydrolase family protein [Pararcticibacter amylolyticus]
MYKIFCSFACYIFWATVSQAQYVKSSVPDTWKGFQRINFSIGDHKAYYVEPKEPLSGKPWVWRSSFPDWHTDMDSILLAKGFHIAYVSVDDQFGSPYAMQVWDRFYLYLTGMKGLASRPALEAVSRGGLYAYGWAKRNPDKVSCIYAEAPVCDIKSWPGGKGSGKGDSTEWKKLLIAMHWDEQQALTFRDNPVDNLEGLASFKVPVLHVIGQDDKIVPNTENTYVLTQRYIALGGPAAVYPVTDGPRQLEGHHFPIRKAREFADFIYRNSFPVNTSLSYKNYITIRGGLQNSFKLFTGKKEATVGFLGGSITHNPGWREKVSLYLSERFPETKFRFIEAAIPSLGSLAHSFRLQQDLLDSGKVDLMFLEAAVNDRGSGIDSVTELRALEGIVRHAKRSNPAMDIIMMSFADTYKTADYAKGKIPLEVFNHELVASHYNLPSINLAKEVADKIKEGEFSWDDDFKDIHPSPFGQELYFATIKSLFQDAFVTQENERNVKSSRPAALIPASFTKGRYYNIRNGKPDAKWTYVPNWKPADHLSTREGFVNVPMLVSEQPGASLVLPFRGTAVGMAIISGADAGIISYSIDKGQVKELDLYTEYSSWLHLPYYILFEGDLKRGSHTLTLTVLDKKNQNSKGNACRVVNFLVNDN